MTPLQKLREITGYPYIILAKALKEANNDIKKANDIAYKVMYDIIAEEMRGSTWSFKKKEIL